MKIATVQTNREKESHTHKHIRLREKLEHSTKGDETRRNEARRITNSLKTSNFHCRKYLYEVRWAFGWNPSCAHVILLCSSTAYVHTYVCTYILNVKCEMNDELALIYDLRTPQNKVLKRAFGVCSFCRATATTFPLALPRFLLKMSCNGYRKS